jgi:hypothetical protein
MRGKPNLQKLLAVLSDEQWHSSDELALKVSFRFGHTIFEARKKGYPVETRRVAHNQFEYRLKALKSSVINPIAIREIA